MSKADEKFDRMIFLLENHLILDLLKSGIKVEDVRKTLKIDKKRVNDISKILNAAKTSKKGE